MSFLEFVVGPIAFAVLIAAIALGIGSCAIDKKDQRSSAVRSAYAVSFDHDGHRWVRGAGGDVPVHHPDCPCLKKPEAE